MKTTITESRAQKATTKMDYDSFMYFYNKQSNFIYKKKKMVYL